jgi:competence protein ComFC
MNINEQELHGNWRAGWALDLHTLSSIPTGDGGFETTRTEVGEALYQLKYHSDRSKIQPLAETACQFMQTRLVMPYLHAIIPVPPSNLSRSFQPVLELAREIGRRLNLPVFDNYLLKTRSTEALKGIDDPETRRKELQGAFRVKYNSLAGRKVLLFDDLFRSGETLTEITDVLYNTGKVQNVYVLTITKTRSKR